MRLFVAIDAAAHVIAGAAALMDELRSRVRRLAPEARVTWVAPGRLHITVRFIGEVDEPRAAQIRAAFAPPLDVPAFDLVFRGDRAHRVIRFDGRILSLSPAAAEGAQTVAREVTARLARVGIPPERRPYWAHLTLARVRERGGLRATPLLQGLEHTDLGTSRVEAITLYESRLSPKGPTYTPLVRTALASADATSAAQQQP